MHPDNETETKDFISASCAVGRNIGDLLKVIPRDVDVGDKAQADLIDFAKQVSTASAGLVNAAKVRCCWCAAVGLWGIFGT